MGRCGCRVFDEFEADQWRWLRAQDEGAVTPKGQAILRALELLSQAEQDEVIAAAIQKPSRRGVDIDVTPFRERYLILHAREGLTAYGLAESLGWFYGQERNGARKGDGTRAMRRLGLAAENGGSGYWTVRRHVSYEVAVKLC